MGSCWRTALDEELCDPETTTGGSTESSFYGIGGFMLKYLAVSTDFKLEFSIAKISSQEDVQALLSRLQPVVTELELRRLGCAGGGYLVPADLDGIEACFSTGVDDRASFDEALLARGIRCHLADASVDRNPVQDERSTSIKKYLGVGNNGLFVTAHLWIDDPEPGNGDLLFQMDIEGAEWPVLLKISDANLALSSDRARAATTSWAGNEPAAA
jgi:hypothetical protein